MSDRIAIFNRGKIEQIGKPSDIYDHPSTQFVAEFIGETNLVRGCVQSVEGGTARVQLPGGQEVFVETATDLRPNSSVCLSIRPERIKVGRREAAGNNITAAVSDIVYHGDHLRLVARSDSQSLTIKTDRSQPTLSIGDEVQLSFLSSDCWVVSA